jgi:hypothetical protein
MEILWNTARGVENTSVVPILNGFRLQSNTSTCNAIVRVYPSFLKVIIPIEHTETLVEPIVSTRSYTRFLRDILHWSPDGAGGLMLRRTHSRISFALLERIGNLINRVFAHNTALEALAGAATELADDPAPVADVPVADVPVPFDEANLFDWDGFGAAFGTESVLD